MGWKRFVQHSDENILLESGGEGGNILVWEI